MRSLNKLPGNSVRVVVGIALAAFAACTILAASVRVSIAYAFHQIHDPATRVSSIEIPNPGSTWLLERIDANPACLRIDNMRSEHGKVTVDLTAVQPICRSTIVASFRRGANVTRTKVFTFLQRLPEQVAHEFNVANAEASFNDGSAGMAATITNDTGTPLTLTGIPAYADFLRYVGTVSVHPGPRRHDVAVPARTSPFPYTIKPHTSATIYVRFEKRGRVNPLYGPVDEGVPQTAVVALNVRYGTSSGVMSIFGRGY